MRQHSVWRQAGLGAGQPWANCSPSLSLGFLGLQIWRWVFVISRVLYGSQSL